MIKIFNNNSHKDLKARYIGSKHVVKVLQGGGLIWKSNDWYGIKWSEATGDILRIGNMEYHRTLPIQSKMRRCSLNDDGTVNKYISQSDFTKYEDGTDVDYSGGDGQIVVEVPEYYFEAYIVEENGTDYNYLALWPTIKYGINSRKFYPGAFEMTVNSSNSSDVNTKAFSISTLDFNAIGVTSDTRTINASEVQYLLDKDNFRNYNYSNTDKTSVKCSLGRPRTGINRATFRTICKHNGENWSQQSWDAYNSILRLYIVEYCNLNSQAAFNPNLDSNGFHQGGLGSGVTNANSTAWSQFNSYNPFVPCGVTVQLSSNTGVVDYVFAEGEFATAAFTAHVPSYRGIENPFGHIWKFIDGFNRRGALDENESAIEEIYICHDVNKFAESTAQTPCPDGYVLDSNTKPANSGYVNKVDFDGKGTFWPKATGTNRYNDYFYNSYTNGTWYTLYAGGSAFFGGNAGLFCFGALDGSGYAYATIGSRLLYTPQN